MISVLPAVKERLFWLKVRPDPLEVLDEPTVTESVLQLLVLDASHTVIVAPPVASPVTESVLPDRFVEATVVLELVDTV